VLPALTAGPGGVTSGEGLDVLRRHLRTSVEWGG
jgi:hypothetical protein